MTRLAVIGSGPGAMYTLKYLLRHCMPSLTKVNILEKLDTPFGLVRFGVAPDHLEVKEVANEFRSFLKDHSGLIDLRRNQLIRSGHELQKLRMEYDGVLLATGAQSAGRLPLAQLPKFTMSAQDFVLWYNGHPEWNHLDLPESARNVTIVGHGNVAFDVARILSKSVAELEAMLKSDMFSEAAFEWLARRQSMEGKLSVSILGRRGYLDAAFTNKEFRELTTLQDATCRVNENELEFSLLELREKSSGNRQKLRGLPILEKCVSSYSDESKKNSIFLRFFTKPVGYMSDPVEGLQVLRHDGNLETIACDLGVESIGFKVTGDLGLPLNMQTGGIAHDGQGRVGDGLYVAGWAKRGPKGVIAANIPCCMQTADAMCLDFASRLV